MSLPKPFTLTPPQLAFATWLAARSGAGATTRPSRQQQCAMWERLTGEALTLAQLKALRASAEFRAALREARGTAEVQIAEAQRLALGMYSTGMKAHARALKRALTDLYWFCANVLGYAQRVPMREPTHLLLCKFVEKRTGHAALDQARYRKIEMPRETGKTTLVTQGYVIQRVCANPDISIL